MGIILELSPDIEARLIAQAAARGLSVEDLLKITVDAFLAASDIPSAEMLSPQERADRFVSWAKKHQLETAPLSDQAISREIIYREREDSQQ